MLKLSENPPMTFPEQASIVDVAGTWWIAHTRSRQEKALARALLAWQAPYFLPLVKTTTYIRRRKFEALKPLFSGYLFFVGDEKTRYNAMTTNRVARVIAVADQLRLIDELTQLQTALSTGASVDPFPYIREGRRCRVKAGPLRGLEGTVVRRRGANKLILQVEAICQGAAVEIDTSLLEPVD